MIPEPRLRAFLEATPDAFFVHDVTGRITDVNRKACTLSGYTREELLGLHILDLEQDFDLDRARQLWLGALPGEAFSFFGTHRRKDGSLFPVEVHLSVYEEQGERVVLGLVHDISQRVETEGLRARQTRLYRALSEINQAIVRMEERSKLFPLVCRVAVEYGGMKVAWIGERLPGSDRIRPAASHGNGLEYVQSLVVSLDAAVPEGRGPTGTAWRERRNVVVNRFQESPMGTAWREQARRYGWGAVGAFPILRARLPVAMLVVYHEHPDAFDEDMVRLLDEMAHDISFAVDNFDREQQRREALAQLKESEARLRLTLEATGIGVWDWDMQRDEWYATPIYFQMLGYAPDAAGQNREVWGGRTHPEDAPFVVQKMHEVRDQGQAGFDISSRFRHADGSYRWINSIGRAVGFDDAGRAVRMLGLQIDITSQRAMVEALRLSEEKFSKVFSTLPNPVSITRLEDGLFVDVNAAWCRFTGYSREQALGRTSLELGVWTDAAVRTGLVAEIRRNGRIRDFPATVNAQDHVAACLISAEAIRIQNEDHLVLVVQDVTEKQRYDTLVWKQANFDLLTDLPNRYMFYDRLAQSLKKAHRDGEVLGLLFIDLDRFKEVNDTLGHHVGDLLLVEMARRIQKCVRATDTVARLGGDEFTVALPQVHDAEQVEKIAQHILERLAEPFTLNESLGQVFISASIGITLYPLDAQDVDQMLKNADQAMYAAKRAGRNRFSFFTPSLQDMAEYRLQMHNDLRLALEQGQFEMHYQPIVHLQEGTVFKAEALLRWHHPKRGLVSPEEFIPLAEETGVVLEIGDWVFRQVTLQMQRWQAAHPQLQVSVNMSPLQFQGDGMQVQEWLACWHEAGLSGQQLVIEITEGLLLGADEAVTDKLRQLHATHVEIAIDDFGTGYSSLSYLSRYPVNYLKIDKVFVRNLVQDASSRTLCEAIIVMAHKLGLRVVAEGIENREQRDFLVATGCDYGQGYYFSRPMPEAGFIAVLAAGPFRV